MRSEGLASAWTGRALSLILRLIARIGVFGITLRLADHVTLARHPDGRIRFPYILRARERAYQVLLFHRVNDDRDPYFGGVPVATFHEQMDLLARHWTVLPLHELVDLAARRALPPRAAAITFDDGYRDNYECAYPILAEHRLPATIFLATGAIETGAPLWHDRVFDAFRRTHVQRLRWGAFDVSMKTQDERLVALHALLRELRALTPSDREAAVAVVRDSLSVPENPELGTSMLTWAQIREMRAERIDFGAHTVSHPILTRMSREAAKQEILDSRRSIENQLGVPIRLFAYPNGKAQDFNRSIQEDLRRAGFQAAVTTIWGKNDVGSDPFELRRMGLSGPDPCRSALRLAWYRLAS